MHRHLPWNVVSGGWTAWTRMTTWLGIHWRDVLLIAAIATSAALGYVSLYAWLIQLAAFQVQ